MALPEWWNRVDQIFRQNGVSTPVWTSIAWAESRFIPWASNTVPPDNSWGLFQLNRLNGQGSGYSSAYLSDPINNAMIAAPRIGNAVKRWGQDNVTEIARWSGHPTEDGSARGDNALLQNIRAAYSVARGKTSDQIYQAFTGGQIPSNPPATPPDSPPGSGGGWLPDPASIGSGFIGGVFHGINTAWQTMIANIIHQGVNAELTTKAPVIFGIGGFFLLVMGLYAAVSRSETVQNTVSLASGVATMGAAGAVKGAASTVTSAARSAPMRTVPSKAVNVGAMRSLPKR